MAEQPQTGGVTLWDLLTLISFVVPVAGAFADAKHSHAGLAGYVLAISVGLAIGVGCAVCMRIALVRVGGYLVAEQCVGEGSVVVLRFDAKCCLHLDGLWAFRGKLACNEDFEIPCMRSLVGKKVRRERR